MFLKPRHRTRSEVYLLEQVLFGPQLGAGWLYCQPAPFFFSVLRDSRTALGKAILHQHLDVYRFVLRRWYNCRVLQDFTFQKYVVTRNAGSHLPFAGPGP